MTISKKIEIILSISCFIACEVIRLTAWGIFAVASDYFKSIGSALGFTRGRLRSDVLR
jgi:hypothetical protein